MEIREAGGEILTVSPDPPKMNAKVRKRKGLDYSIGADQDLSTTRRYGVEHPGAERMVDYDIPRPAVFVIDGDGVVRWRFLTDNWRIRVRPEAIIEALKAERPAGSNP